MNDLRKCPFCGCDARVEMTGTTVENGEEYDDYTVVCTNRECLCFLGVGLFKSKEVVIDAWNSRVGGDDCVSRQAAIDAAKDWYDGLICGSFRGLEKRLKALPLAQPEVVRCKDCKFYSPMNRETKTGICNLIMHQNFGDNWFCAGAERRTDERKA